MTPTDNHTRCLGEVLGEHDHGGNNLCPLREGCWRFTTRVYKGNKRSWFAGIPYHKTRGCSEFLPLED